ncbi:MAG: alpha/beta fold hydrolase [Verrucomicrobiota bacterium]
MPLQLHSLRYENPGAPVMIILHGLLGSSRNWTTIGRAMQTDYDVHAVDLRNHGSSPHAESMRWAEMLGDVKAYLAGNDIEQCCLIGHSLGGKVAMRFACEWPELVQKLIIADIAAKAYPPHHDVEFKAMKRIAVGELSNRKEAEELLEPLVPDWAMRQFLLTNLLRDDATGAFKWQINLEGLHVSLPHIRQNALRADDRFDGPTLLIRGGKSDFIVDGDAEAMGEWFPQLTEVTIPGSGHNVHVEDRKAFLEVLRTWL